MNRVIKIKIIVNNNIYEIRKNQYKFIRDSQYAQYQGLNRCMGYLVMGYYANNMDFEVKDLKNIKEQLLMVPVFLMELTLGQA
ncbi:hypothetical protein GKZ28_21955 [Clostridium chromiireducens]|uniref:Uncharacterized protein n=1 Tax=Clostridium chromiireducens TaxID=225345 RepID=A0A964RQZ0_9CLOT|nr:hypothetical protein [Clostridium chromiireducens]MVX66344.1 hypothetical protein [Clostridium chromiireducens]